MSGAARRLNLLVVAGALSLTGSGCVFHGGSGDFLEGPGTPVGITVLRVPFEKFVTAAPPPAGFSSTHQKMLLDRQRIAKKQMEREAQQNDKLSGSKANDRQRSPTPCS